MRAAAYIRVSTQEQKLHGYSLPAQREKLQSYADANGMEIVAWYADEGVSGRKLISKRPALQKMISDAEAGQFSHIIFIKLDRFFRSVAEYHECMKRLGDVTWTATEEKYDLSTANGRMFVNMKLTIAELEADQTGERIRMVRDHMIKAGIPIASEKRMPFYMGREGKQIVKRNEEATLAAVEAVEATGSVRAAMSLVNEKYGLGLTYNSVYRALKNTLLYGAHPRNPNLWEGIISKGRWEALQQIMDHGPRADQKTTYIFTGLLRCPECGRSMAGSVHKTTVAGHEYRYSGYRCPTHRKSKTCSFSGMVFENWLEKSLLAVLEADTIGTSASGLGEAGQRKIDTAPMQEELSRLNSAWIKGRIQEDEYDRRYDEITARIADAEKKNAALDRTAENLLAHLPDGWRTIYDELGLEGKQAFWRSTVSRIEFSWGRGKASKKITRVDYLW